jgi:hypothetical protein
MTETQEARAMSFTVEQQASAAMFVALCQIAEGGYSAEDAAAKALSAIKEAERIQRDGAPLHGVETSEREHGERMGQPPGVLYTLTVTEDGDANEWRSDLVQTPEQVAWLHEMVSAAAAHLAGTASGSGGLN